MKKIIILFGSFLAFYVLGEYTRPENAKDYKGIQQIEFLTNPEFWKPYAKANLEYFRKLNNPAHNFCGDTENKILTRDFSNISRALSNEGYGNIKFLKMKNTDVFYKTGDSFQCDMNLTILKHEFPMQTRRKLVDQKKEERDGFYWTRPMIATRWNIAAQSLKKCGIRIKDISLISFETKAYKPENGLDPFGIPTFYTGTAKANSIVSALNQDEELLKKRTVKSFYTGEVPTKGTRIEAATAGTHLDEDGPIMRYVWLKRMSIASPMFPPGLDLQDTGYLDELHELYHLLTGKTEKECHFDPSKFPNRFGPMSDDYGNQGGTFNPQECEEMRKLGEKSKFLTCYPKRPFQPSADVN